jgi:hypothetical protein
MLCQKNKFFCDACCDLQEAEKRYLSPLLFTYLHHADNVLHRMKIKKLPNVLALHLKRFKYQEDPQKSEIKLIKLSYRVAFPLELRLFNTVDEMDDADRLYNLFAIVVHIGTYVSQFTTVLPYTDSLLVAPNSGPHHGHYVSLIKTLGTWLLFDDDTVSLVAEHDIPRYFGDSPAGSAYVLYYQAADIDLPALGLRDCPASAPAPASAGLTPQPHIQPYAETMTGPTPSTSTSTSASAHTLGTPDLSLTHPVPAHPGSQHSPVLPPGLMHVGEDSSDQSSDPSAPVTPPLEYHSVEVNGVGAMKSNGRGHGKNSGEELSVSPNVGVGAGLNGRPSSPVHDAVRSKTISTQPGRESGGREGKAEGVRPASSRSGLFKTIRKTPSMSIKTGLNAFGHIIVSSPSPVANHNLNGTGIVVGRRSISPIHGGVSPTSGGGSGGDGKSMSRNESETSPTKQQRPTTAAGGGGRSGRPNTSSAPLVPLRPRTAVGDGARHEENGDRRSVTLSGSAEGNGNVNGEKDKDKEQKKMGWFGKRKSIRALEKDKEGGRDKEREKTTAALDFLVNGRSGGGGGGGEDGHPSSTWFRTSMQKARRPSAEVIDVRSPSGVVSSSAPAASGPLQSSSPLHSVPVPQPGVYISSPSTLGSGREREKERDDREREREKEREHRHRGYRDAHHQHTQSHSRQHSYEHPHPQQHPQQQHSHQHPQQHQHEHAHVRHPSVENGISMSPSPSSDSHHASHARARTHGHGHENGHKHGHRHGHHDSHSQPPRQTTLPAPRMQFSSSTPASASTAIPMPLMPPVPHSPIHHSARNPAPGSSSSSAHTQTPERKKSMPSILSSRDRDRDREQEKEEWERERLRMAAGRATRPSTAGAVVNGKNGNVHGHGDRPLPPVPQLPLHGKQMSTTSINGSVLGGSVRSSPSPTRGAMDIPGSQNHPYVAPGVRISSSVGSVSGNGNGNSPVLGFKRATRKLSLTAPMLGFGKKDKDKDKDKDKEREREGEGEDCTDCFHGSILILDTGCSTVFCVFLSRAIQSISCTPTESKAIISTTAICAIGYTSSREISPPYSGICTHLFIHSFVRIDLFNPASFFLDSWTRTYIIVFDYDDTVYAVPCCICLFLSFTEMA